MCDFRLDPQWAQARNILVMRLDNIGDVVMTGPALRTIKEALPEARLTLMASPSGAQAAPLLPWIDEVLVERVLWQDLGQLEFDPERERVLVNRLRKGAFDAVVILTSFSQSPYPAAWIALQAGIPLRLGSSKEQESVETLTHAPPSPPDSVHQVERNLRLLEAVGLPVSDRRLELKIGPDARREAMDVKVAHGLAPDAPYLLLAPWASCPARTYHPERFAATGHIIAEATGLPVLVTGAARDRERRDEILPGLGKHGVDLVGKTSVPAMAALVEEAALLLTNDSLPMHLGDACKTPAVVLYAGTELESQWAPRHSPHRLLRVPTFCSPCYAFSCPYDLECLDIPAVEVAAAGLELLRRWSGEAFSRSRGAPLVNEEKETTPGSYPYPW